MSLLALALALQPVTGAAIVVASTHNVEGGTSGHTRDENFERRRLIFYGLVVRVRAGVVFLLCAISTPVKRWRRGRRLPAPLPLGVFRPPPQGQQAVASCTRHDKS